MERIVYNPETLSYEVRQLSGWRAVLHFSLMAIGAVAVVAAFCWLWFVKLGNDLPKTVISREYSSEWKPGDEPYYPVNNERNSALYQKYKARADRESNVIFGGRLGEYKYYDMDQVILSAMQMSKAELAE